MPARIIHVTRAQRKRRVLDYTPGSGALITIGRQNFLQQVCITMASLGDNLIHTSNRLIDLILGVDHSEVLNAGSSAAKVQNPAEQMMKVSKELLALGFD